MNLNFALRLFLVIAFAFAVLALDNAEAQHLDYHRGHYYPHRNVPHFHDAAGHMVDRYGHHIDGHGNHTRIGVYENGSISPYSKTPGVLPSYGYGGHGYYSGYSLYDDNFGFRAFYPVAPSATLGAPSNSLPAVSRVVIGSNSNSQKQSRWPTRGPVIISNPKDSGGDVRYTLNGTEYTIKPGYQQKFEDDRAWVVAFGSGGAKGDLKYTLVAGTYNFVPAESGWDLKLSKEAPPVPTDIPPPLPSPE